ncbi:MAG TPA: type II CAAX endopeptidase family protein [Gemmatimonadaceae bacterium]
MTGTFRITSPAPLLTAALSRRPTLREMAIVLGIPTALFLAVSLTWLVRTGGIVRISDARLAATIGVELVITLAMVPYLRKQGWRPGAIAESPTSFDLLRGFGVFLAANLAVYLVFLTVYFASQGSAAVVLSPRITGTVSPLAVTITAIINPVFEEFLWLGYAIPAIGARYGLNIAVAGSIALRVAVHAYQGSLAFMSILPIALVFTWYFVRTGRLWPVIVAHVMADALSLAFLAPTR